MIAPLAILLTTLIAAVPIQDRPAPDPAEDDAGDHEHAAQDSEEDRGLPPPEPPPPLSASKESSLGRAIKSLRASNAKARAKTEAKVIAFGRGAIPYLLAQAFTDHEGQRAGLVTCLVAVADLRDRNLVTLCLTHEWITARRFGARKAGDFALPEQLDALVPLLDDEDEVVRIETALSLVSNGRPEGLATLVPQLRSDWRPRVLVALPGISGQGTHRSVADMLVIDPRRERDDPEGSTNTRLNAVELLHVIGDEAARGLLVRALDDKHNVVQREAINSLRDLLEQQGPMKTPSIFQQINEVKRLKQVWRER
jgi:hypothetical protein